MCKRQCHEPSRFTAEVMGSCGVVEGGEEASMVETHRLRSRGTDFLRQVFDEMSTRCGFKSKTRSSRTGLVKPVIMYERRKASGIV